MDAGGSCRSGWKNLRGGLLNTEELRLGGGREHFSREVSRGRVMQVGLRVDSEISRRTVRFRRAVGECCVVAVLELGLMFCLDRTGVRFQGIAMALMVGYCSFYLGIGYG